MNLLEDIARIKEVMGLKEQSFNQNMRDKEVEKEKEEFKYKDKKYNPDSDLDFSNSKVKDIGWRAGGMELFPHAGGLWFAENKEDVEKFAMSVRNEKREGKPYRINLQNPKYYSDFWHDYLGRIGYDKKGKEQLMYDLIKKGYDGIIIDTDTWNDTGDEYSVTSKQYIVFNPENVKPA